jgi:S1-C subfamily serine protease
MTKTSRFSHLLSGLAGGLAVAVVAVALLATGAIDTGEDAPSLAQQSALPEEQAGQDGNALSVNQIYERTSPGVVFVQARGAPSAGFESPFGLPEDRGGTASGSGFVLDRDGFVLSNAHVVDRARDVTVTLGDDEEVPAEVVGADLSSDLAVLKIDPEEVRNLTPLPLGESRDVEVGDPTVAIGNPFGFDRTVTTGIVSAIQRQITAPNGFSIDNVLQTDASINPGNSGGPLLDARGRVIGVNSQIATGGASGSVGIGFAVPIDAAKEVIPELKESGEVERAFLGVTTTDVTDTIAEDFNLPVDEGALVQDVVPNGPAGEAGLRAGRTETTEGLVAGGDIIVSVDGEPVAESADVAAAIADNEPGDTVEVEVLRGDAEETIDVELGRRPARVEGEQTPGGGIEPPGGGVEPPGESPFPLP